MKEHNTIYEYLISIQNLNKISIWKPQVCWLNLRLPTQVVKVSLSKTPYLFLANRLCPVDSVVSV